MSATSLRLIIDHAKTQHGKPLKDLTVLSPGRDPYRLDTPAGHARGRWLAESYAIVNPDGDRMHSRGLHYRLVGRVTLPDGRPYANDDDTWVWMSEHAVKAARWLGYLPWSALRDARSAPPEVYRPDYNPAFWTLTTGRVDLRIPRVLDPTLELRGDLARQPFQQIIIAEKQGISDILRPIAREFGATLALPSGELSDQMLYDLMSDAAEDGRPLVIHQLGDFDPAGHQMAVSTARTAQALRDAQFPELEVRVHAVGLTLDQCQAWRLPSTPLKETEKRADRWTEAMGWEQTELDAAASLVPREFARVIRASLAQYRDPDLSRRAFEVRSELEREANARLAEQIDDQMMVAIRAGAEQRLAELQSLANEINEALHFDPESIGLDLPDDPPPMHGTPSITGAALFDSHDDWTDATARLIARKRYVETVEAAA